MPKQSWNKFVNDHPSRIAFVAAVSARLPPTVQFDKTGTKLPSPFGLFNQWANGQLTGKWASSKVPNGFLFLVSDTSDAAIIEKIFGFIGPVRQTPASPNTQKIGYSDALYVKLARHLGYKV